MFPNDSLENRSLFGHVNSDAIRDVSSRRFLETLLGYFVGKYRNSRNSSKDHQEIFFRGVPIWESKR